MDSIFIGFKNRYCPVCHADLTATNGWITSSGHFLADKNVLSIKDHAEVKVTCCRCSSCDKQMWRSDARGCFGPWKFEYGLMADVWGDLDGTEDSGLVPILNASGQPQ